MMTADFSPHQRRIVDRYYDHLDTIKLTRLQEIVTELFLAESEARRKQLWNRADKAMRALAIPAKVRDHILSRKNIETLATHLRTWLSKK